MSEKISLRDAFWNRLYELAILDRNIIVVTADMGAPALDKFKRDLSSQFVDVGIAEQQAIAVASGLALSGKKVFAYAIAPFITLRCYEHIRVNLAGMCLPVTLVGVGAGFSYDDSGPTHHTFEDVSVLRILPHFQINNISDNAMASAFADISCGLKGPNYVRLDRQALPDIYKNGQDFSRGFAVLKQGKGDFIIATGNMTHCALEVASKLKNKFANLGVIDLYSLPINEKPFLNEIRGAGKIITLEEHTLPGGFGSAVCELLSDNNLHIPLKRMGLDLSKGYCYKYGGRKNIQSIFGLDAENVASSVSEFLGKK